MAKDRHLCRAPLMVGHDFRRVTSPYHGRPTEITDITATILEAAGLSPKEALSQSWPSFQNGIPCRSLLPVLAGEAGSVREYAFSECRNIWQCITSANYKYVKFLNYENPDVSPEERLYDIVNDPHEQVNLITEPTHKETADWHRRRLQFVLDKTPPLQHRWAPLP